MSNFLRHYKRSGEPYPETFDGMRQWGKDFNNKKIHIVKQERLKNGYFVSTVWLGLDHRWKQDGPPLIFETMVFMKSVKGDDGLGGEADCERYSTEAEALEGHKKFVADYKDRPSLNARILESDDDIR